MFVTKQQKKEKQTTYRKMILTAAAFVLIWVVMLTGVHRLEKGYEKKQESQEQALLEQSAEESSLQEQVDVLGETLADVKEKYDRQKEQVESAEEAGQAYESQLAWYEEENGKIQGEYEQVQQENADLGQQVSDLQAQLQQIQESIAAAQKAADQVNGKTVYITFDDGPSNLTTSVLDVLDRYGIKATFFVTYKPDYESVYKEIVNRGHAIGIHTSTHDYDYVYSSYENWLADFTQVYNYVIQVTGVTPQVYRFPGGSNGSHASRAVVQQAVSYLKSLGMQYFDWNVANGDGAIVTAAESYNNIVSTIRNRTLPVVLMHDGLNKETTLESLPSIFQQLVDWGYRFGTLNASTPPIHQKECWDY